MMKPTNVLVNPATGQVRHMGFGIASRLLRELQAPEPPDFIADHSLTWPPKLGHESESRHAARIFDSIPSLVHTGRPDGYLDYFNQRWLEYEFGES